MRIELNEAWRLRSEELAVAAEDSDLVAAREEHWLPATLPCDIHMPLIEAGIIRDPVLADYSYACEWTESKSWWFAKEFELEAEALAACDRAELRFERIDGDASVFVNGRLLGSHRSAFFPFAADAKRLLTAGRNRILVRVSSAVEGIAEELLAPFRDSIATEEAQGRGDRGDRRRAFVRGPQYVYGWDWGPRVVTCGLTGGAQLELQRLALVRDAALRTARLAKDGSSATIAIDAELELLRSFSTAEAEVRVELRRAGADPASAPLASARLELSLRAGLNHADFELELAEPELWWPNGYGGQPLYEARIAAVVDGESLPVYTRSFGVRSLELDQRKLETGGRAFAFVVNGLPVFCKGANWIPADSIYARVGAQKYERLVEEARAAHFTMLRVWGGGLYESELFYELCDRAGILVWQDFMYACACYPDRDEGFLRLAEREAEYQLRRLRSHPCLALWCGNNECEQIYDEVWSKGSSRPPYFGGARIYDELLPELVRALSPWVPYWNSSPFGGESPNSGEQGDHHHWFDCMMHPDMARRIAPEEYDATRASFVSEYGYPGPCALSSIERYHDGAPLDPASRVWKLHNNTFEKDTVLAGIDRHYVDAEGLALDDYLEYASACQALMLGYSLEALRAKSACSGALFWMYDDCWGEVGWTIIDYYLERKPSWYAVRRALSPRRLVLRRDGASGLCRVILCNDSAAAFEGELECGWISYDGSRSVSTKSRASVGAAERRVVALVPMAGLSEDEGCFFARPVDRADGQASPLESASLRPATRRPYMSLAARPEIRELRVGDDGNLDFIVSSELFAHGLHFRLPAGFLASDEHFDLLPGESRRISVTSPAEASAAPPIPRAWALNRAR